MKRYSINGTFFYCPVDLTLHIVSGRWKGLVIWNLRDGARRYGELKRALVVVNDKMLSQTLKELEEQGVVSRFDHKTNPPRVEYDLTAAGRSLLPIMQAMSDFGTAFETAD